MSNESPLIVSMTVEAFVVNDKVRTSGNAFLRNQMDYNAIQRCGNGQPGRNNNDTNFTKDPDWSVPPNNIPAGDFYNGIYLKWRLPTAFTQGTQKSAQGVTDFLPVPNRWLIVRYSGAALDSRTATAWIVESDYEYPASPSPMNASEVPCVYVQPGENGVTPAGIFMGRNVELGGWTESGHTLNLQAMAPGNPAFAFYQPQCNNVFSFIDCINTLPEQLLSYVVFGWFSNPANDPLVSATSENFLSLLTTLGWTLPPETEPTLTASSSLLYGSVDGVAWQNESLPPGGIAKDTPVSVAVGNSSVEALTAMITAQAAQKNIAVDSELLEAFQLDLIDAFDRPDGAAFLADKLHSSFFQKFSGGYLWTIVDAPDVTSQISEQEREIESVWLATLNQNQAALDAALQELAALQTNLYEMWWKYTNWPFKFHGTTTIPGLQNQTELKTQLDPTVAGSIAQKTLAQGELVQVMKASVPNGDTPDDLEKAITDYAILHNLPSTRVLKRSAAPLFYLANNPVLVIAGAGASGIVENSSSALCRFPSQVVTGFVFIDQIINASTPGLKIPQPDLSQVFGVPWSTLLITLLVQEFFFLDPNNAAAVSAVIPGSTVEALQQAMENQQNDVGIYPTSAVQQWTENPWHPLNLFWEVNYYPISYGTPESTNWTFDNGQYAWNGSQESIGQLLGLKGLIHLTPAAAFNMGARIQSFLNNNPNLNPQELLEFQALWEFVQSNDAWDLLSQTLDGFGNQIQLGVPGVFLSPGSTTLLTEPSLSLLIGSAAQYPTGLPDIPATGPPFPPSGFQPWRAGQFVFLNLILVDEWGQALWPISADTFERERIYMPDDLTPVLISNAVPLTVVSPPAIEPAIDSNNAGPVGGPTINSLNPSLVQAGMVPSAEFALTINGAGFVTGAIVQWNDTPLNTEVISDTTLVAMVSASFVFAPGSASVTVVSDGVTSNSATVTISPGAAIVSIDPDQVIGSEAFTLTVNGVGFQPNSLVYWDKSALTTTFVSATQITAEVPAELITPPAIVDITERAGFKVLPSEADSFVQMPPALLQPARLEFNLISAIDDKIVFGPANPGTDPICGWILPNHLDHSLLAYDAAGIFLGELSSGITATDQPAICWTIAPNGPYTSLSEIAAAIPHFGPFLIELSLLTPATLNAFLAAVDETLWTTVPVGASFDRSLAALIGRPLAMVRSRLEFVLSGTPYTDPSWQFTFDPASAEITAYQFAIELGNIAQLDDGLIGYFIADDYTRFNVVSQSGASAGSYLFPIGVNNNYIYESFDGNSSTYVSMLVDPRAPVHATTGILPAAKVDLPPDFVVNALAAINVTFRVNGILTDQQISDTGEQTILMPVPTEKSGEWSWLENDEDTWTSYATGPNDATARLSNVMPVLRRGLLQLSGALGENKGGNHMLKSLADKPTKKERE